MGIKKTVHTIYKYLLKIFFSVIAFVLLYFLVAIVLSVIGTSPDKSVCADTKEVFISTNGVHLDIIIAKGDFKSEIRKDLKLSSQVNFLSFGWGDKGFYLETPTWAELKFSTAIKAVFLKSETAMHLTKYSRKRSQWVSVQICADQLKTLIQYIEDSFEKDSSGRITEIPESGYATTDTFYEANGNYNGFYTCNYWVNKALKKAGVKTSVWSPFDKGVLYHLRKD